MKNISWGTKIAVLYIGFVLLIVTMVAMAMNQKIELVNEDYYANELVYQNKIDEMNNANALTEKIEHQIIDDVLQLRFPAFFEGQSVSGNIFFYRPSDKDKDVAIPVQLNEQLQQTVAMSKFQKGMYKMQVSWTADDKNYYSEEVIVMP